MMKIRLALMTMFISTVLYAADFVQVLQEPSIRSGLCVVVGCSNAGELIRAQADGKYLVQGVSSNQKTVSAVHASLENQGLTGTLSVALSNGAQLPYIDNLVNTLVVLDRGSLTQEELLRVVSPFGSVIFKKNGQWTSIEKPYPEELDEWPMYRHDLERSNQLQDDVVKTPSGLQWVSGSPMAEYMTSQVITANGRIFYSRSRELKNKNYTGNRGILIVRDAFNGLLLWQKEMKKSHGWSRSCLAVHGGRLYALMDEGMVAMDVETGEVLQTYEGVSTPEVSYVNGTLIFDRGKMAVDAESGTVLWKNKLRTYHTPDCLIMTDRLIVGDKESMVCLDLKTGEELWRSTLDEPVGLEFIWNDLFFVTTRKLSDQTFHAFRISDGSLVWKREGAGFSAVVGGLGWVYYSDGKSKKKNQSWIGLDPKTGEEKTHAPYEVSYVKGPRCYPARSTKNLFMPNFGGVFFLDPAEGTYTDSFAGRGTCRFGLLPSNGMVYQPVNTCSCYPLMRGDVAFFCGDLPKLDEATPDVVKGPAFTRPAGKTEVNVADWPTLRNDGPRSGRTATALKKNLRMAWKTPIADKVSSPVVAGPNAYVAAPEHHQVVAINRGSGKIAWRYTASAVVDSPPTIAGNLVLFGSADGWAYCLDSSDGALRWRFRAAPIDLRLISNGEIESLWPVHGSLLVVENTVYFAAGRHAELNDGIFLYALDLKTGDVRWNRKVTRPDYQQNAHGWQVDSGNNRILSSDGKTLHLDRHFYDLETGEEQDAAEGRSLWGGLMGILVDNVSLDKSAKTESFKYWTYNNIENHKKSTKVLQIWTRNKANILAITDSVVCGVRQDQHEIFASATDAQSILESKEASPWLWSVTMPEESVLTSILIADETVLVGGSDAEGPQVWKFDLNTGEKIGEMKLPAAPRFDGLAVAGGDLFVATEEGQILRFSGK